ncbi:MAG: manganese-binding transcriptional regulator MntR [Proteobacteria bacterium]|nr:manganese-binding transcriptional regulator MntR [Pseudomonadota bacterium]
MSIEPKNIKNPNRFSDTRIAHQLEHAEDYVEIILDLIEENGEARLLDIAKRIGVAHPTAAKTLKKIQKEGLVNIQPYRSIELTRKGKILANECRHRHEIVLKFLIAIGVDSKTAQIDSEGMEHHVSPKTLKIMQKFINSNASID